MPTVRRSSGCPGMARGWRSPRHRPWGCSPSAFFTSAGPSDASPTSPESLSRRTAPGAFRDRRSDRPAARIPSRPKTRGPSMSRPVIICDRLGKRYNLRTSGGSPRGGPPSLREAISEALRAGRDVLAGRRGVSPRGTREFWALKDVSFEVERGEVVGIIGHNGAGKSTLLKILSRIVEPTGGTARLRGRLASLLEVGTGFHPELTGRENIYLNGAILGMRKAEIDRKFDEIVACAEIEQFLDTPVKRYSSGMYVRLAFAVAAHLEPEILIVDEVLAVGDYAFQKKCLGKMSAVAAEEDRTVLFVSHNLGSIAGLCQKAICLANGRLCAVGPASDIVTLYVASQTEKPRHTYDYRDLGTAERQTGRLLITALDVNNGSPVVHREPFCARLHFRTSMAVDGVAFGLAFCTMEGTRLATFDSDLDGLKRSYPAGYEGWIDFKLSELPLGPGQYALDIGA